MKVRLLATDAKYPNLAIMKLSTYHKKLGDDVDWYTHDKDFCDTDILYISKIFTFSEDPNHLPMNENCKIIKGGTGYDIKSKLPDEVENISELDYTLYPECDYSIVFTTRGCFRQCPFCVVHEKEGFMHSIKHTDLNPNGKYIMILDNNFFGNRTWRERLATLKSYNQPLYFNAGIDLRILTEEMCVEMSKCRIKQINCAFDNYKDKEVIMPKLKLLTRYIKPYKVLVYVLVGFENRDIVETDIERVNLIWELKAYPFVMGYINFNDPNWEKSRSVKDFARWCNNRFVFKSCTWEEYKLRMEEKRSKKKNTSKICV